MKLLNHTLLYFSVILLAIISVWAALFYFEILDEVYDSLDDGLENYKMLIIEKAHSDTSVLYKTTFAESNYAIHEVPASFAVEARDIYRDTMMYMQNEEDFEPVRMLTTVFAMPDGKYYQLKVISSMVEEDDLIEDLLYSLFWLYIAMLVSILLMNNILLKRIWNPFYQLLGQLKKFRLGSNDTFTPPPTKVKEFRDLNEAVSTLLKHNLDVYNSQKQFIENASHELQTPLAISINKMELLADRPDTTEEQQKELSHVIQSLERLTRLNKSLLLLSRIENKQFTESEPVDINALIKRMVADFSDLADFKTTAFTIIEDGHLVRNMHKDLAEILYNNLLKNAIVHNKEDGQIVIRITDSVFSIENSGNPVPLNAAHIFDRFYKESGGKNSTGLGLSIVKAITDLYRFRITYTFTGNHRFIILF